MKKLFIFSVLVFGFAGVGRAWFGDDSADRTVRVVYSTAPLAATTATTTLVIDLSSTTVWPHKQTREINISSIRLEIDKAAASTGTVRLGVMNLVNTSSGSVTWFFEKSFLKNVSNADNDIFRNYGKNFIRTRVEGGGNVVDGTTPYLLSSDKTTLSSAYQSDLNLIAVTGSQLFPARGDIILDIAKDSGNAWVLNLEIDYHTPSAQ